MLAVNLSERNEVFFETTPINITWLNGDFEFPWCGWAGIGPYPNLVKFSIRPTKTQPPKNKFSITILNLRARRVVSNHRELHGLL